MKPEEALQLLDQAVSMAALNRSSHAQTIEAIRVLQQAIAPKPKEEPKKG